MRKGRNYFKLEISYKFSFRFSLRQKDATEKVYCYFHYSSVRKIVTVLLDKQEVELKIIGPSNYVETGS